MAAIELADAHDRILAASTDPALQELRVAIDALHGEVETADENVLTVRIGEASQALEAYAKNAADSTRLDEADLDVLRLSLSHVLHLRDLPVDGTALLPNDAKK